jgi:hypothetical protein
MTTKFEYFIDLRDALRSQTNARHIEQCAPLGYGSDFEKCPNITCLKIAQLLQYTEPYELQTREVTHE